jgi:hypothetical protein
MPKIGPIHFASRRQASGTGIEGWNFVMAQADEGACHQRVLGQPRGSTRATAGIASPGHPAVRSSNSQSSCSMAAPCVLAQASTKGLGARTRDLPDHPRAPDEPGRPPTPWDPQAPIEIPPIAPMQAAGSGTWIGHRAT